MAITYCGKQICGNTRRVGSTWSDGSWDSRCIDCRDREREDSQFREYQDRGGAHNFWLWKFHREKGTLDI